MPNYLNLSYYLLVNLNKGYLNAMSLKSVCSEIWKTNVAVKLIIVED